MQDVDDTLSRTIQESGGYKKFALANLSRLAKSKDIDKYSVTMTLSELFLPSIACREVEIKRSFSTKDESDHLEILIDGQLNELRKRLAQKFSSMISFFREKLQSSFSLMLKKLCPSLK